LEKLNKSAFLNIIKNKTVSIYKTIILFSLLTTISCKSQDFVKVILKSPDTSNLYINDGKSNELYYLKLIPKGPVKGAIVILPSGGETTQDLLKQISIPKLTFNKGIATIIPAINWGTEDRNVEIETLDIIFKEIIEKHNIPKDNFILGGLSNGGMISLVYAEQSVKDKKKTLLKPKGVFGLDVPLDKAHFYEYCQREIKRNFSEIGVEEARWIMNNYNEVYGGSPEEFSDIYI